MAAKPTFSTCIRDESRSGDVKGMVTIEVGVRNGIVSDLQVDRTRKCVETIGDTTDSDASSIVSYLGHLLRETEAAATVRDLDKMMWALGEITLHIVRYQVFTFARLTIMIDGLNKNDYPISAAIVALARINVLKLDLANQKVPFLSFHAYQIFRMCHLLLERRLGRGKYQFFVKTMCMDQFKGLDEWVAVFNGISSRERAAERANCLNLIGRLYCKMKDHGTSVSIWKLAIQILEAEFGSFVQNFASYAHLHYRIGCSYAELHNVNAALQYWSQAISHVEKATDFQNCEVKAKNARDFRKQVGKLVGPRRNPCADRY